MTVTLERLLTDPKAFGLTKATPVQRAICRIADGLPLGDLAEDEVVVRAVGGPEAIAALPSSPPKELYIVAAIRCGKSLLSAALACKTALTLDLSMMGKDEIARVSVVSLDFDKAKAVMGFLRAAVEREDGALRRYFVKSTEGRVLLKRHDGRKVEILIGAGRRGGANLVSRWTIAAIFDEAARMLGKDDGVINFDDMQKSVIARLGLVPGAQLIAVTSPWAARGPIYEAAQEYWGRPTDRLVVVRATGPMMNPVLWTPEACENERMNPRGAYETDVLGEFVDPESGFVTAKEVRSATRASPIELPRETGIEYTAAMDPAVAGNAWTLVIVGRWPGDTETQDKYKVALARQWQGSRAEPLKARDVFAEMGPVLAKYGVSEVHTDRWSGHLIAEHGDYAGISVNMAKDTPEEVSRHHADFRTRLLDGRLELAPVAALAADLLSTRKKLTPGGAVKYEYPLTRDGRHADFAPAAVLAVARASSTPGWVHAMNQLRAREGVV